MMEGVGGSKKGRFFCFPGVSGRRRGRCALQFYKATGNKAGVRYVSRRKWDTKSWLLASIDRAGELIGYEPETSFEDGLERTTQWFKDNWDKIEAAARFGPGVSAAVREVTVVK